MAINVADNFSYKGGKPLDNRTKYTSVADMVATPAADLYDGCLAYVTATKKNYQYDSTNETDLTLGKWRELQTGGGTDYTAGDGIDITDDAISVDEMPSEDMDEIVSPKPVTAKGGHRYSTEEQIVGTWIDGSTLYEKTYPFTTATTAGEAVNVDLANENMTKVIDVDAFIFWGASTKNYVRLIYADFNNFSNVSNMGNCYTSGGSSSHVLTVKVYGNNFLGKDGYATIIYTKV